MKIVFLPLVFLYFVGFAWTEIEENFSPVAIYRRHIRASTKKDEDLEAQNSANHILDDTEISDEDVSFLDYPTYTKIPTTDFSCKGKINWHYYADIDTDCQTFHICETQYSKISFLCPIGSVFNQRHLVCDWWYNVDCTDSEDLYILRSTFNRNLEEDEISFDLNLASSGGNSPSESTTSASSKPNENKRSRKVKS